MFTLIIANKEEKITSVSVDNIYKLNGRVPLAKAIPFGLQHVLAMLMGAFILILASLFPPLGAFFNSLPQSVLGGCTVMMFGSIMYEGIKMLKDCEFDDRTMIIVSLSFCIGVGLTQTSGNFFAAFPSAVCDIFNGNAVAGVFVVSLLLSLFLPKEKAEKAE